MKTQKSVAFRAISVVFLSILFIAGGILNPISFAENNKKDQDKKVKSLPDLKGWPEASQTAVREMLKKYGMPDEATEHTLVWHNNGPWKCTKVFDRESRHLFPIEHTDVLEQTIDYKVPLNKYNDLALYDGSVFIKRTDGELSVRCDRECVNFLSINLANDIAIGKMSVGEARTFYANAVKDFILLGKVSPYMQSFQFTTRGKTTDADRPAVNEDEQKAISAKAREMNKELKEKEKLSTEQTVQ
jgi:hypothetical protein